MSEFKPMTKMKTTEPTAILKLKVGGAVSNGRAPVSNTNEMPFKKKGGSIADESRDVDGDSPKKPSVSARSKAMAGKLVKGNEKSFSKTKMVSEVDGANQDVKIGGADVKKAGYACGGNVKKKG